jgi:hypothetical protein
MRNEIGIDTILFGRDYPHFESTWPHTREWLQDAFHGVPEDELRKVLGENAIRFLGLDRAPLAAIAAEIGPTVAEINDGPLPIRQDLMDNFDARGGYHKPAERGSRINTIESLVEGDVSALART